jgi:TP901 family phage tail tape measure protein
MAEDANANIRVDIDTAAALASIKNLQRQISAFHTNMAKGGAAAAATSMNLQQGLLNSINRTGQFSATIKNVKSTTESFTNALEKNKLSMREYFRYSGAATKTFGRFFRTEFDTINKVARERVKDLQTQYIRMGRDANGAIKAIAVRPLALDMESLGTKTQIAAQRQALLNQMLKQGSTNLLNFGKNTQWAGRQLMVGFTIPLVMFGSVASKTFMDMEKQAIRFKRVYGELFTTTEQTNKALAEIKDLANEFTRYGIAVSKTMELAADIAATGKMGADLTAQVAESTRLAVLGGVEQAEALKATISLTDAFGVSAEDLAGKIDFLNAVENQTVTSIEDLTIAIPKAGPVVQQLGGDVQDLTFFLTAMREGGINASEGANALKSGLASMINPTGKAAEMLQGFGINLKGIVEANKGNVKGIVIDFAKALDTLDPLNRAQAIEQLFGKFQFARLSTLFQNVIKEGNQASRVLKLANATTEELAILSERELKKVEDSPMFKFQKAVEDIKVTLVPLGEAFLKAVTPVLEFGTKILEKFNELDAGAKQFVVGLTAIAGVIGPVFLMGFGLIANGVANVIKGFVFFKTAMNKAASSSTQLGLQTEYMTQQQLEAAAVASSLNQVHQTLRQTFTSEAGAVDALTAAYRRSLAAQTAMSGGVIGRTRAPKKYASGVLSVPGPKGAGDVVPAMLSPGEAVIPAKQSKKYSGIISSLISDNVPGFRIGRNPFASMLGRSNVGVRMQSQAFSQALASGNKKYQSGFATGTGDDFLSKYGLKKPKQKQLRTKLEQDVFGLPGSTSAGQRPTYGFASSSPLQTILNTLLFGKTGARASGAMNPRSSKLDRYGDLSLITKGSVAKRSSAYAGDILLDYSRNRNLSSSPAPMRGATRSQSQAAQFGRFGQPFGNIPTGGNSFTTNPKPPYIETYTPGGFAFKEIDKIIARDPAIAKQLKQELRAAGMGSVRVVGSGFVARLFKKMGVPGYSQGSKAISGSTDGEHWVEFLGKRFKTRGRFAERNAKKLPETIEAMRVSGRPDESILRRLTDLSDREQILTPSRVNNTATSSGKRHEYTISGGSGSGVGTLTGSVIKSGLFNDEIKFLEAEAKKLGISNSQLARFTKIDASHFAAKGDGIKDWKDISKIGPDVGGLNNYLNRVSGNLGKHLMSLSDGQLRRLKIKDRKELEKLVSGDHPKTKAAAATLKAITTFDEKVWSKNSRNSKVREGKYQAILTRKLLDRRFERNLYDRGLRTYSQLIGENVIEDKRRQSQTIGGSDEKVPAGARVSGGSASDTRMAAVTPGETILTKKTNRELMRGRGVMLPGIGRLATLGSSNFPRLPGFADGFPEGQTPDRRSSGISQAYGMSSKDWDKATKDEQAKLRAQRKKNEAAEKQRRVAETKARLVDEQKVAEEKTRLATKEEKRLARQSKMRGMGGKVAGGVGAAAMVGVIGGSMVGGQIGEIANQLMMPVMMLSMIAPMLASKVGLVVAALAAVVGGFVAVQIALQNIRKESFDATRSLSSGKDAMSRFAEAAGTVTPSEFMEKRRQQQFSPFTVQTGKTTFGQSFVQSEAGQGMLSEFENQTEKFGRSKAIESLQKKLTTAVATGVLSPEQAKSIANSLGQKLNDYNVTANINASIQSIIGPDGKLLEGNTIKIYTEFVKGSTSGIAGAGGILQSKDFTDKAGPLWWMDTERVAKLEGEAAGIVANFYDENQQLVDAFDVENLKNIDKLYAEGKYDEALALEEKYQIERAGLIETYTSEIYKLQKDFSAADFANQQGILSQLANTAIGLDPKVGEAARKLQGSSAVVAKNAFGQDVSTKTLRATGGGRLTGAENIAKEAAFQEVKLQILGELTAGNIDSETFNGLMKMFDPTTGKGQATLSVLADISTKVGPQSLGQLETVFAILKDPEVAYQISLSINRKSEKQAKDTVDTLTQIATFDGNAIEPEVVLKFYGENLNKLTELTEKFNKLKDLENKGMLNVESLIEQKIITAEQGAQFDDFYKDLPPDQKVVYTQVYATQYETVLKAPDMIQAWRNTQKPAFESKLTDEQVASIIAGEDAEQYVTGNLAKDPTGEIDTEKTPTGGTKKESPYKNVLTDLKELRQDAVKATGGLKELTKWLGKAKDMRPFKGTMNALVAGGTTEEFQSFISGLDKSEQNKLFKISKGVAKLTNEGKALQKTFNEISIGGFVIDQQRAIANSKNQKIAAERLISAGMAASDAYSAVEDAAFAAGIATMKLGKKGREELKTIVNSAKEAEKAIREISPESLASFLKESIDSATERVEINFEFAVSGDMTAIRSAESDIAALQFQIDDFQAGLQEISWKEDAINDKYDKRAEALDKVRRINSDISDQQKGQLSLAEAITRGDLSAAAQAVQNIRETQAEQAFERQSSALESAREKELGFVRSSKGKSRLQLEEDILKKEKEIFAIEEDRLEPARERVRLIEVERETALASLKLQSLKYDDLVNKINSAKFSTKEYADSLKEALATLQQMAGMQLPGGSGGFEGSRPGPEKDGSFVGQLGPQGNFVWDGKSWVKIGSETGKNILTPNPEFKPTPGNTRPGPEKPGDKPGQVGPGGQFIWNGVQWVKRAMGGKIMANYSNGGSPLGSDIVPAMLTPGEFVIRRPAVRKFGPKFFEQLNNGMIPSFNNPSFKGTTGNYGVDSAPVNINVPSISDNSSVYNYNLSVNVSSVSDPNAIAQTVMGQIRRIDSQRIRSNRF